MNHAQVVLPSKVLVCSGFAAVRFAAVTVTVIVRFACSPLLLLAQRLRDVQPHLPSFLNGVAQRAAPSGVGFWLDEWRGVSSVGAASPQQSLENEHLLLQLPVFFLQAWDRYTEVQPSGSRVQACVKCAMKAAASMHHAAAWMCMTGPPPCAMHAPIAA